MDINQLLQKIPKPILILTVLILALTFFVYNDPLKDECEVQTSLFEKKMAGLLFKEKKGKKTQFPKISYWKDRCRSGNSVGACEDYFEGLRLFTKEFRTINETCQKKYAEAEENAWLISILADSLKIIALVAWGDRPPSGVAERAGWLGEGELKTFCYLKKTFSLLSTDENMLALRETVYNQYPGEWSDKFNVDNLITATMQGEAAKPKASEDETARIDEDELIRKRIDQSRPRAYKSSSNPNGTLTREQVYERSIFSLRCDMYM